MYEIKLDGEISHSINRDSISAVFGVATFSIIGLFATLSITTLPLS